MDFEFSSEQEALRASVRRFLADRAPIAFVREMLDDERGPLVCEVLRRAHRVLAPTAAAIFDPYIKALNAMPRVILAPIFMVWFGLGMTSKVALGVTLVFFIVFFNVYQGVKEVSPTVLDNGRMLGMNDRQLMRHVYWPSALSWMFSSLHTSVGFAVVGAVVGEYLGSAAGLGYLIQQAEGIFDVAGVFAGMFVLSAFVLLIDYAVTLVERRLLVWRPVSNEGRG